MNSSTSITSVPPVPGPSSGSPSLYLACGFCPFTANSEWHLQNHLHTVHYGLSEPLRCPECPFAATRQEFLTIHFKMTHGRVMTNGKDAAISSNPNPNQAKSVHASAEFSCEKCSFVANHQAQLQKHINGVHEKQKRFSCEQCEFTTAWRDSYLRHVKNFHAMTTEGPSHSLMPSERFQCQFCSFNSNWKASFTRHLRSVHNTSISAASSDSLMRSPPIVSSSEGILSFQNDPLSTLSPSVPEKVPTFVKENFCDICGLSAASKTALEAHKTAVHQNNKAFKCTEPDCNFVSAWKMSLSRHIKVAHSSEKADKFKCAECSFSTSWSNSFVRHMNSIHFKDAFNCSTCSFSFNNTEAWNKHVKSHANGRIHVDFAKHDKVSKHEERNGARLCHKCDFQTTSKSALLHHCKTEHGEILQHKCDFCAFSTSWRDSLIRHLKSAHGNISGLRCGQCSFRTASKTGLSKHIRDQHGGINGVIFKCDICDFTSTQKHVLDCHKESVHQKKRTFNCDQCQFSSTQKKLFAFHTRREHGTKAAIFRCRKCLVSFHSKRKLLEHLMTKHKEASLIKCELCSFLCRRHEALVRHFKRVHNPENGFCCDVCNFRTKSSNCLIRHKKVVHKILVPDEGANGISSEYHSNTDPPMDEDLNDGEFDGENFSDDDDDAIPEPRIKIEQSEMKQYFPANNVLEENIKFHYVHNNV